jgi:hypothetical protein
MDNYDQYALFRFWERVNVTESCWEWTGSLLRNGYGGFSWHGNITAHRMSYIFNVGPIPDGLWIDHMCMNKKCVNPAHMRAVPPRVNATENSNSAAAKNKRKTHCVHGHALSGSNLRIRFDRGMYIRRCRTCIKLTQDKRRKALAEIERLMGEK